MRRDFRQLLTLIQALALLQQRRRERDAHGRLVATLDDYAAARGLLLEVFTTAATGGVSPTVRETADALASAYDGSAPLSQAELARELGLSHNATRSRVRETVRLGYIRNLEPRRGRAAQLVPGDSLPEDRPVLPTPEELDALMCEGTADPDGELATAESAAIPADGDRAEASPDRHALPGAAHTSVSADGAGR